MAGGTEKYRGIALALVSAVLFGASVPLAKLLVGAVDPWLLAGLLYLGSGIGLAAVNIVQRIAAREPRETPIRRADLTWLAGAILAGGAIGPVLLMVGLAATEASVAALLLNLEGLATIAIAWLVFRENLDRRLLTGGALILAGAIVVSWQGGAMTPSFGALAIVGACVFWGIDNNLTRKISASDPLQITAAKGLVAGAVNCALAFANGAALPPIDAALGAAFVGFAGYGVSLTLFVLALRHLGAARTGAYFSTAPFAGAALAVALLGEPITLQLALAAAFMAAGVWLHVTERHDHEHAHERMAHDHAHMHDQHHRHSHGDARAPDEPHAHWHVHDKMIHSHPHYPDLHHHHAHKG